MKHPANLPAYRKALADEQAANQAFATRNAQLTNDLAAARIRFDRLEEACDNLRRDHALQSNALVAAMRERDDWRDAFKLIMKLVK